MRDNPTTDMARRIRALLDKAENTEFDTERDAFTAKALQLMMEYRISEAMLDAAAGTTQRRGLLGDRDIQLGSGPYVRARLALLAQVSDANGCSVVTRVDWEGRVATVHGFDSDLARTELAYTSLLVQATSQAHHVRSVTGSSTVSVRRSFLFGYAERIGERLRAAASRAVEDDLVDGTTTSPRSESVAVVLADRRAEVDDYVRRRYGRLGTLGATSVSREGYGHGRRAADHADLGAARSMPSGAKGAIGA